MVLIIAGACIGTLIGLAIGAYLVLRFAGSILEAFWGGWGR